MKKRIMKKYIPKNTIYCGSCRWRKYLGKKFLHRNPEELRELPAYKCEHSNSCKEKCWSTPNTRCEINVWRCDYLKYTDTNQESLLWDGCKECGVHYPKN